FIQVKNDPRELTNFNLSVAVTDAFMKALHEDRTYPLINPRTGRITGRLSARKVFNRVTESSCRTGEPGLLFIDRINRDNPTPQVGMIEATNPCGEQPLLPNEACNLGSINLSRMVVQKKGAWGLDLRRLKETVQHGIHFLDNVVDVNAYPLSQIEEMTRGNRRVGLGVMGFADLLIRLNIPYDSDEALQLAESVMSLIQETAWQASERLARERGPFPHFKGSRLEADHRSPVRNATRTTIAPTGSLSIIAGCSGGIEPLYGVSFSRNLMEGLRLTEVHPLFIEMARHRGIGVEKIRRKAASAESIQDIPGIPKEMKRVFVTAFDVSPQWHVRMQAAFQKHVDNAVSKTVNLPPRAARQDVESVFLEAYRLGCKGITVYRSGSREDQVLTCADLLYC
ncbi:MAG: adenosylcobalamin-dependent ribonucleoside-diphosphate reductase, partial [Nitrospirae bacterium]|nr:adenosylcobalamin-dependent ribonucleoside-diphosphate reductase [Nitrospirota bacterium]